MPALIHNLPFFTQPTTVSVRGRSVPVFPDQIVVWISLSTMGRREWDARVPRLPAVLDTGCNHSFLISQRHLVEWAGIRPESLGSFGLTRVYGGLVPQLEADVWLYPNQPGERDQFVSRSPFLLETNRGVAVVPSKGGIVEPRLPLLGMRALRWNHLTLAIDCHRYRVTIRTRRRYWLFG